MTNANQAPVIIRRGRQKEIHTGDMNVPQKPTVDIENLEQDGGREQHSSSIALDVPVSGDYHAHLAYAEQPVTIRVERENSKNAASYVECYVNGRGAEILHDGKWLPVGWVPCGVPFTTKRKYVEVLMRSRPVDLETEVIMPNDANPMNRLIQTSRQKFPLSIIKDDRPIDPSGVEWASRIMSEH